MSHINFSPKQSIISESRNYYQIISELGFGGNSNAFIANCTSGEMKGIQFSLKVFTNIEREERKAKFLTEIDFLESIKHPAIIRVFDKGQFDTGKGRFPFIVYEYYPHTLLDIMKKGSSIADKVIIITNILSALNYLTLLDKKIIHRDIKPQNIFIKGKSAVLGDFGLMKIIDSEDDVEADREEIANSNAGMAFFYRTKDLIDYMNTGSTVTQSSDLFQFGLVVAQLFTGLNPCVKPEKITDPLIMNPLGTINSRKYSGLLASMINKMLVVDSRQRVKTDECLNNWNGILETVVTEYIEINGCI